MQLKESGSKVNRTLGRDGDCPVRNSEGVTETVELVG